MLPYRFIYKAVKDKESRIRGYIKWCKSIRGLPYILNINATLQNALIDIYPNYYLLDYIAPIRIKAIYLPAIPKARKYPSRLRRLYS